MNDLISRKALIEDIKKYVSGTPLQEMFETIIDNQPTAYDVDKVVEWLEDDRQQALSMADKSEYFLGQATLLSRVIPLVKGAVKDE